MNRPLRSGTQTTLFALEAERKRDDEDLLFRMYKAWRKGQVEALREGPHGRDVEALRALLKRLSPDARQPATGRDLVAYVEAAGWAKDLPRPDRMVVLHMIGAALVWAREKRGLPPFDDPMPGEPENAFLACKRLLEVR